MISLENEEMSDRTEQGATSQSISLSLRSDLTQMSPMDDSSGLTSPSPMDNTVLPSKNQSTVKSSTPTTSASTSPTSGTGEFACHYHYHNHICFRARESLRPSNIFRYLMLLQKNFRLLLLLLSTTILLGLR